MKKFDIRLFVTQIMPKKLLHIFTLVLPFLLMDSYIRLLSTNVNYKMEIITTPSVLFSVVWIFLFVAISLILKGRLGRIFYALCFGIFFVLFLTHAIYYPYTGFFFTLNLLQSASEGSAYIWSTVAQAGFITFFNCFLVLLSGVFAIIIFPRIYPGKRKLKFRILGVLCAITVFTLVHTSIPKMLGTANSSLEWDTWRNPRNVYDNFSDSNKNIKICGLYEYSIRDFYVTFLKSKDQVDPEEIEFLQDQYSQKTRHLPNNYTGLFEGKNVIFVQMEGIDSWLLNETDMPTLYNMCMNSIYFNNHYSYYNGGGSTFNSELALSTGFLTPISFTKNPYAFNTNLYPGSLPKLFKERGYTTNAFHMNTGEYYMRELNYVNWGYDNYYSLVDDGNYSDKSYELDRELIQNKFFYDKMFKQDGPFMHYIITYTPHTPFSTDSEVGKLLSQRVYGSSSDAPSMSEEDTARFFASETDRMFQLLLQALRDNDLIDNTVIVAFSDHYLYTLNDKTILDKYKTTENNLINRTPFLIWSNDTNPQIIESVNSQLDILPTVLNMFGFDYVEEYYIGNDIMDIDYTGYVFFSDYSWYDGVNYVEFGEAINNPNANTEYINQVNTRINTLIRRNDLTLKYDYFRMAKNKKSP